MPPRAGFTRERIEEAAYQLAREKGFEAIAARETAKSMGMTVTPIFTCFSGMEELKTAVRDRVRREFEDYLRGSLSIGGARDLLSSHGIKAQKKGHLPGNSPE